MQSDNLRQKLKQDFPQMPPEIHNIIGQEVNRQLTSSPRRSSAKQRLLFFILAAALLLGTVAFAGLQFYQLYVENEGTYGRKIHVEGNVGRDEAIALRHLIQLIPERLAQAMLDGPIRMVPEQLIRMALAAGCSFIIFRKAWDWITMDLSCICRFFLGNFCFSDPAGSRYFHRKSCPVGKLCYIQRRAGNRKSSSCLSDASEYL